MKFEIGSTEAKYEPGSDGKVFKNRIGITSEGEMNEAEEVLLNKLYEKVFGEEFSINSLRSQSIKDWYRKWLGPI